MIQSNIAAELRMLSFTELERLCQRRSIDIQRLANLCGHNILSGQAPSLGLATGINMLIHQKGQEAGFEPSVMRNWLPHLRNETLLRLGEDLENWVCPEPSEEWQSYVTQLYGVRENTRPHIGRLLPGCSTDPTAWKVRFFSSADVETLKDENDSWASHGRTPRLVIDADDLAQRIKAVCVGPLFTVRPKGRLAA